MHVLSPTRWCFAVPLLFALQGSVACHSNGAGAGGAGGTSVTTGSASIGATGSSGALAASASSGVGAGAGGTGASASSTSASSGASQSASASASTTGASSSSSSSSSSTSGGVANPAFANLGDSSVLDLGPLTCTPVGNAVGCNQVTDYSGFVYDANHHQFLMFGGGHATTMTDSIFAFDLDASLTWKELYAPTPCGQMTAQNLDAADGAWLAGASGPYPRPLAAHTFDMIAYAPAQDEFVLISRLFNGGYCSQVGNDVGGPVAHYGLASGAWSFTNQFVANGTNIDATEYDPKSGLVVVFGRSGLGLYDPAAKTFQWSVDASNGGTLNDSNGQPADFSSLGYGNDLVYFPPSDTFYYFNRNDGTTHALALNRAQPTASILDVVATSGPMPSLEEPGYAFDAHNQILGGGVQNGQFFAFDPATGTWTAHAINGGAPADQAYLALSYDPLDNVFVFLDVNHETWAYRLKN